MKDERGIPKEKIIEAIELSLATAYKKEYGKKGQFIRAHFDLDTGKTDFYQVKQIVDKDQVVFEDELMNRDIETGGNPPPPKTAPAWQWKKLGSTTNIIY